MTVRGWLATARYSRAVKLGLEGVSMASSAPPMVSEPVTFALFAPNERGLYVRKNKYVSAMQLSAQVHKERLDGLKSVTLQMAESNARLRKFLGLPPFGEDKK